MKTLIITRFALVILFNFTLYNLAYTQEAWINVGKAGFSPDARMTALCLDSKGMPYVVFQEYFPSFNEITVMKYTGGAWETVGSPKFSPGSTNFPHIALGTNDTPYVVFRDAANGGQAKVMKFNGTNWVTVGDLSSISGGVRYTTIHMDKNGLPYIGFSEDSDSSRSTVMKYNGNSWIPIGKRGFSAGSAGEPRLVLGQNDTPFMIYKDGRNDEKVTVMKFDGLNWSPVGNVGFSNGSGAHPVIAVNSKGQPIVAYIDVYNGNKATVMEFKDGSWSVKGTALDQSFEISLALGENDTPYLAFNPTSSQKANVVKFNGNSWINVGDNDFSPGKLSYLSIAFNNNYKPFVVFLDGKNASPPSLGKISVMSYENLTSITTSPSAGSSLLIIPNPADDFVQVSFDAKENVNGTITIVNHLGQIVKMQAIQMNAGVCHYTLDLTEITSGIYLVKIQYGMQVRVEKMIVR